MACFSLMAEYVMACQGITIQSVNGVSREKECYMTEKVRKFVDYCETELDLTRTETYCYKSLSVCLLDSIYSLMNRYTVCEEIVARYVDKFMDGDKSKEGDNLSDLIANMDYAGGPVEFGYKVFLRR